MGRNTVWTACNRRLLKDGSLFFVRGVNYQPTPITRWSGLDLLLQPAIWQRDLPLIRNMNANAVKVYDYRTGQAPAHLAFLDAAYNNGYNPLYVMFSVWVPPNLMTGYVPINDPSFQTYVAAYQAMAAEVACHPGTMGFVIGGEINFYPDVATPLFWQKFNQLVIATRTGMAIAGCSVKIVTSNFIDDYAQSVIYGEQYGAAVDIWGVTVYDNRFSSAKVQAFAQATSRPYMFAEFGVSYATNVNEVYGQSLWNVEQYLMSMATFLESNFMNNYLPILVGGFVFEYSDEWWKEGDPYTHNNAMLASSIFPLGFNAEEHYGIFSCASTSSGLDLMQPRTIAAQLSALWSTTIDSQPYACNNPSSVVFPSATTPTSSLDCNISSAAISVGISVYSDPICTQTGGAMGCRNSPTSSCRLCQLFSTPQSAPYVNCPTTNPPAASSCANATLMCPNGMVLQPNASCQFDSCPSATCVVDDISLRQGLGSIFDPECVVNIQADGCDVFNRGCRLCRQPFSRNTIYDDCPYVGSDPTTSPPPTDCSATQSDLNVGIATTYNTSCSSLGGVGCDPMRLNCQFCRFRNTVQSIALYPCPSSNLTSSQQLASTTTPASSSQNYIPFIVVFIVLAVSGIAFLVIKAFQLHRTQPRTRQLVQLTPKGPSIL